MKKFYSFLMAGLAILAVSCSKSSGGGTEDPEPEPTPTTGGTIQAAPATYSTVADGSTTTINLIAKGAWTATADCDWITVTPSSGAAASKVQTVTLTVAQYTDEDDRTGKVTFATSNKESVVTVTQTGIDIKEYHITSYEELIKWVGRAARWSAEDEVYLEADIDLKGPDTEWNAVDGFLGSFYGQSHKIYNFKNAASASCYGFFGDCSPTMIQDVIFGSKTGTAYDGVSKYEITESASFSAGFIAKLGGSGKVQNVVSYVPLTTAASVTGTANVGGIAGTDSQVQVSNCKNYGAFKLMATDQNHYMGGIVGKMSSSAKVLSCESYGDITSASTKLAADSSRATGQESMACIGGLVGFEKDVAITTLTDCVVACNIVSSIPDVTADWTKNTKVSAGMVVGRWNESSKVFVAGTKANPIKVSGEFCGTALTSSNYTNYLTGSNSKNTYKGDNKYHELHVEFGE